MEREPDDPPMLAGQSARDMLWALERVLGADVVQAGLARVPEAARRAYADASPLDWVPYETVVTVHQAIAHAGETTMEAMIDEAVPLAVRRSFKTVWRIFLRFTSDEALIKRTPLIYSRTRSRGTMEARMIAPGKGLAEVRGWRGIPPRDIRALAVGMEELLRLADREGVVVRGRATADGAAFDIRWR